MNTEQGGISKASFWEKEGLQNVGNSLMLKLIMCMLLRSFKSLAWLKTTGWRYSDWTWSADNWYLKNTASSNTIWRAFCAFQINGNIVCACLSLRSLYIDRWTTRGCALQSEKTWCGSSVIFKITSRKSALSAAWNQ